MEPVDITWLSKSNISLSRAGSARVGWSAFLPAFEAVCGRQDPAGADEDASAAVEVLPVTGLVNVDGGLPRLLRDVALFASEHAERRAVQGVVQTLATRCCRRGWVMRNRAVCRRESRGVWRRPTVPLLLSLLVGGARGPRVVMTDGRFAKKNRNVELFLFFFYAHRQECFADKVTHGILGRHTAPRSGSCFCRCDTTALHHRLDFCPTNLSFNVCCYTFLSGTFNARQHLYLQKLWLPSPSSAALEFQALFTLRLTAGESHGRQREPLLVTDLVPLYDWPEPSAHSLFLSAQNTHTVHTKTNKYFSFNTHDNSFLHVQISLFVFNTFWTFG